MANYPTARCISEQVDAERNYVKNPVINLVGTRPKGKNQKLLVTFNRGRGRNGLNKQQRTHLRR